MGMGLVFGVILDQIAIGLCLGVAIGLALDNNKPNDGNTNYLTHKVSSYKIKSKN